MSQHLAYKFEFKADAAGEGTFTGYGSVFGNVDSYQDIVAPGAFAESIKSYANNNQKLPILWQHSAQSPIGVFTGMKEDDHGLLLEGRINLEVQQGREAYALLKQGAITGLSIGYRTKNYEVDKEREVVILKQIDLYEVSLVTFPANDQARVSRVKSDEILTIRDLEKSLRDAGYSRGEALRISSRFQAKSDPSDSVPPELIANQLNQFVNTLKGN